MNLSAKLVDVTVPLDPAEFASSPMHETGAPRTVLNISLPDRNIIANIDSKSLFHARTAILATGPENIALLLQGKLVSGDMVSDARLSALPKMPNPQPVESHSSVIAATS